MLSDGPNDRPATLLKKRLRHMCSPVNFAKFLRTSFLQNTSGGCFCNNNVEFHDKKFIVCYTVTPVYSGHALKWTPGKYGQ